MGAFARRIRYLGGTLLSLVFAAAIVAALLFAVRAATGPRERDF